MGITRDRLFRPILETRVEHTEDLQKPFISDD